MVMLILLTIYYIDPSGEFSLGTIATIAIFNVLLSTTGILTGSYLSLIQQSEEGERTRTWTGEIATLTPDLPYSSINSGFASIGLGMQGGLLFDVDKADEEPTQQNGVFLLLGGSIGMSYGATSPIGFSLGAFEVKTPTLFKRARSLAGGYVLGDVGGNLAGAGFSESPFALGFGRGNASGVNVNTDIAAIGLSYSSGLSIPLRISPEGEGLLP